MTMTSSTNVQHPLLGQFTILIVSICISLHCNLVHSMGTHILHAGPSCIIQPVRSSTTHHHHHHTIHQRGLDYTLGLRHHRGICYSSLLCKQKGGVSIGKCGLGNACCIFPQSCSSISVRNSTYFTNADYPAFTNGSSLLTTLDDCALTIHRMPGIHPICQLRLDFIEYDIEGHDGNEVTTTAASSASSSGNGQKLEDSPTNDISGHHHEDDDCASDRITLRGMHTEDDIVTPICARKIGHHVTIDVHKHVGPFILTVHSSPSARHFRRNRRWNILVNQIECSRTARATISGGGSISANRNNRV